jgi:hypothetical protein
MAMVVVLWVTGCTLQVGPPTLPLTPGAEYVHVRDNDTIKKEPIDTSVCKSLGQIDTGPVGWNDWEVMVKNETFGKGGNLFFGTSWYGGGPNPSMTRVTGVAYLCPDLPRVVEPPMQKVTKK